VVTGSAYRHSPAPVLDIVDAQGSDFYGPKVE
jgi:hypothetical protein